MLNTRDRYRKIQRYLNLLYDNMWKEITPIEDIKFLDCEYKENNEFPDLALFKDLDKNGEWGSGNDSHAWFHFEVNNDIAGAFLRVHTGRGGWDAENPQFIIYVDGEMRQGLDVNHRDLLLDTGRSDVYVYGYTGPRIARTKFLADVRVLNEEVYGLCYDIRYPFEALRFLDEESGDYAEIVKHLYNAVSMLSLYDMNSDEFFASVKSAREYLDSEFYGKYCSDSTPTTICIGHTHIDCAWKWTLRQTREKVQRSFSTVIELMRRYPEYKFMSSQAFLYQNLKEEAPEVYEKVKEMIKEKRWECEGAMWVEADCNLSSGESLVRQVLYGKNFFMDEFGVNNRVLWLPDVFGYSAALPQILKKSGVDWFVTSKISWNDTNRLPYDTFSWKGIDGTEINSYFLTAQDAYRGHTGNGTTYVGNTHSPMVMGTYKRYQQKDLSNETLLTFGYGDGGGGPTEDFLELLRRGEKGIPGAPVTKIEFAGDFLSRLEKKIENNRELPVWQGELYLEFHRGTYTTMAKNKKSNRYSELLYQDAELLSSYAKDLLGEEFPKAELHKGWEMILTNQFHDIIPGSSIKEVYDQSEIDYKIISDIGEGIRDKVYGSIASRIDSNKGYVVFNPHSFTGKGIVKVDGKSAYVDIGASKGYFTANDFDFECGVCFDGNKIETSALAITFNDNYEIVSIYDKRADRELVKKGEKCEIRVYADWPDTYDGWEWQNYSRGEWKTVSEVTSAERISDGVRAGIRIIRPFMSSEIRQNIWLYKDSTRIDFETEIDWNERHKMVKAVFPTDINTDKASFEIQYGKLERPTHYNTSWDQARFEVCAHKYADLSEGGFGVSLMNDCKYGYDIHDSVMMLSLLRGSTDPNPEADLGLNSFTYSVMTHEGRLEDSDTVKEAYYLNYPLAAVKASGDKSYLPESYSSVSVSKSNVICECVKEAERTDERILRLYECMNIRTKAEISVGENYTKAYLCDLMENEISELEIKNGKIAYTFGGFEIVTVKLK